MYALIFASLLIFPGTEGVVPSCKRSSLLNFTNGTFTVKAHYPTNVSHLGFNDTLKAYILCRSDQEITLRRTEKRVVDGYRVKAICVNLTRVCDNPLHERDLNGTCSCRSVTEDLSCLGKRLYLDFSDCVLKCCSDVRDTFVDGVCLKPLPKYSLTFDADVEVSKGSISKNKISTQVNIPGCGVELTADEVLKIACERDGSKVYRGDLCLCKNPLLVLNGTGHCVPADDSFLNTSCLMGYIPTEYRLSCHCPPPALLNHKRECVCPFPWVGSSPCRCPQTFTLSSGSCTCQSPRVVNTLTGLCECPAKGLIDCKVPERYTLSPDGSLSCASGCTLSDGKCSDLQYTPTCDPSKGLSPLGGVCVCPERFSTRLSPTEGYYCSEIYPRIGKFGEPLTCAPGWLLFTAEGTCEVDISKYLKLPLSVKLLQGNLGQYQCKVKGALFKGSECSCPLGSREVNSECLCYSSQASISGKECICNDLDKALDGTLTRCICKIPLVEVEGQCVECPQGRVYDPSLKICTCKVPLIEVEGVCLECPSGRVYGPSLKICTCEIPLVEVEGVCLECPQGRVYSPSLKICICKVPFIEVQGECIECAQGRVYSPSLKICICKPLHVFSSFSDICFPCTFPGQRITNDHKCVCLPGFWESECNLKCIDGQLSPPVIVDQFIFKTCQCPSSHIFTTDSGGKCTRCPDGDEPKPSIFTNPSGSCTPCPSPYYGTGGLCNSTCRTGTINQARTACIPTQPTCTIMCPSDSIRNEQACTCTCTGANKVLVVIGVSNVCVCDGDNGWGNLGAQPCVQCSSLNGGGTAATNVAGLRTCSCDSGMFTGTTCQPSGGGGGPF
jgi:hypothetical protein